jgi:hypothetical protein
MLKISAVTSTMAESPKQAALRDGRIGLPADGSDFNGGCGVSADPG